MVQTLGAVQRVRVEDKAKEIGCTPEYLRRQMKAGKWNLGEVVKPQVSGCQHEYFIFRAKLKRNNFSADFLISNVKIKA